MTGVIGLIAWSSDVLRPDSLRYRRSLAASRLEMTIAASRLEMTLEVQIAIFLRRRALLMTETELKLIAALAMMGESKIPKNG